MNLIQNTFKLNSQLFFNMGIPFYFYYICRKYKSQNIVFETLQERPDYLYFDYNSLIHPCINNVLENIDETTLNELSIDELETIFIDKCLKYTEDIVTRINPKEKVVIVVDGVAPRAKMNQQRERRYKSVFLSNKKWDTNQITPGTPFMSKLNKRLLYLESNSSGKVLISDSTKIGEGEHKIMNMITNHIDSSKTHCIYGLDADLIMLSLINGKRNKITLFRDNSKYDINHANRFQYLSIDLLSQFLVYDIISYTNFSNEEIISHFSRFIFDYIFLCFLFGNDFLPHLPCLSIKNNGVDVIMRAYTNVLNNTNSTYLTHFLINDTYNSFSISNVVNVSFFTNVLLQLTTLQEINPIRFMDELPQRDNVICYIDNTNDSPYLLDTSKQRIRKKEVSIKQKYYTYYSLDINDSILNYLEGMLWVFGYYLNHIHNNWKWYYRYDVAPLVDDLIYFLQNIYKRLPNDITINEAPSYTEREQLLLVLPLYTLDKMKHLEETKWLQKLEELKNTKEFTQFFPDTLYLDCLNVEYLWQAKPIFKNIPDTFLSTILN